MTLEYTIDLDGMGFVRSVTDYTDLRDHRLAHRDKISLKVRFTRSGVAQDIGTIVSAGTHFTVKKLNEDDEVLSDDATVTTWTETTSGTDVYYTHDGEISLDTNELDTFIGQASSVQAEVQFTWQVGARVYRSRLLKTTIERALYPATIPPTLATDPARSYVTMLQNVDKLDGDGSGSVALESITTVGLQVPRWFSFVRTTDGLLYYYQLRAGTDAESGTNIRRPDDYNATTNAKVFDYQVAAYSGGTPWGQITGTLANQTDLQAALDLKATDADLDSHVANTSNPHSVTKAQVGLSDVDNLSAANLPVSTATQAALDLKENTQTAASQAEAEAGTETAIRKWSPLRIAQAIDALAPTGGGAATWGGITGTLSNQTDLATALGLRLLASSNLSDLTNAGTARTNLGLGTLATQNGTITDYLTTATAATTYEPKIEFPAVRKVFTSGSSSTDAEFSDVTTLLDWVAGGLGVLQGSILYKGFGGWSILTPGSSGNFLQTNGVGANPSWAAVASGITISSTSITGGTSGRLLTSGTTVGELTLGTGVSTFLGTPTIANLNSAVSDADVAVLAGNAFTGANTLTLSALGTTTTAGISLINSTAAAAGAQQVSPALLLRGNGWKTTATAASQTVDFIQDVLPVQGAAAPAGTWRLRASINGGAAANVMEIDSAGALYLPNGAAGSTGKVFEYSGGSVRLSPSGITAFVGSGASPVILGNTYFGGNFSGGSLSSDGTGNIAMRGHYDPSAAQSFRIYDTYTSATDYHRLGIATVRISQTANAGATITLTGLIPDGAVVIGVTTKVTTALTGGVTGYQVGTGADPDRWGVAATATVGTTTDNRDWTSGTIECFTAATDVILTANGANFSGTGVIYVTVQYMRGEAD